MRRHFIIYDGRACGGRKTDDASVMSETSSLAAAKREARQLGDAAVYSYVERDGQLTDERWEFDAIHGMIFA